MPENLWKLSVTYLFEDTDFPIGGLQPRFNKLSPPNRGTCISNEGKIMIKSTQILLLCLLYESMFFLSKVFIFCEY